jgi:hypothetical protein
MLSDFSLYPAVKLGQVKSRAYWNLRYEAISIANGQWQLAADPSMMIAGPAQGNIPNIPLPPK